MRAVLDHSAPTPSRSPKKATFGTTLVTKLTKEEEQGPARTQEGQTTRDQRSRTHLPRSLWCVRAARLSATRKAEYEVQIQEFRNSLN